MRKRNYGISIFGNPGEFRGDFTRDTFDPANHYSRVFLQQGRVSIDADFNEQVSILHHYQRLFTTAVIGPHAAPWGRPNDFEVHVKEEEFLVTRGMYFVNGLLCVNDQVRTGGALNELIGCECEELEDGVYLIYLDAWERHLSYIEDDTMREQALGGADTATRARIEWRVRGKKVDLEVWERWKREAEEAAERGIEVDDYALFRQIVREDLKPGSGIMRARTKPVHRKDSDLCESDAGQGYRGKENQLYRVEICRAGSAEEATFKWSRENSSVAFPIREIKGAVISLEEVGGGCFGLEVNHWVEIVAGDPGGHCHQCRLYQVHEIDEAKALVTLTKPVKDLPEASAMEGAYLRRWDQADGDEKGILVARAVAEPYELEDGVEIQFGHAEKRKIEHGPESAARVEITEADLEVVIDDHGGKVIVNREFRYQAGDYWLIPARSASNSIEWPSEEGKAAWLPPHGVFHHYAPLKVLVRNDSEWSAQIDTRRVITRNWEAAKDAAGAKPAGPDRARAMLDITDQPKSRGGRKKTSRRSKKKTTSRASKKQ
ncbi:MAG: hypothetical protein KJO72_01310 [Gammaproteobacteria bacterium]|nr:hypothetical protein [Gammaproteobacteria bacterium]